MPRMTDYWYIGEAQRIGPHWEDADVVPDVQISGAGPNAREETGAYVNVWIPDPPAEIDPLEVYKRETE